MGINFIIAYTLLFLLFAWVSKWIPRNYNKLCQCLFVFAMLFVFFCLRDLPVLNDTSHYYEDFMKRISYSQYFVEPLTHIDQWERFEPGYLIYMKVVARYIWNDPYAIILVTGTIISAANVALVARFTDKICIVFFCLFACLTLFDQYSALRQGIAAVIFYGAFFKLVKRQYLRYILFVILAMTFHYSAVILFVPLILVNIKYTKFNILVLVIVSVLIMNNISELMQTYGTDVYVDIQEERTRFPLAGFIKFLITCIVMYYSYTLKKTYNLQIQNEKAFWGMSMFMAAIQMVSLEMLVLSRYSIFFMPFLFIMYFSYYGLVSDSQIAKKQLKLLGAFLFFFMLVVVLYRTNWHHIIPYSFYDFGAISHETRLGEGYD